jgi:hypothetical protein
MGESDPRLRGSCACGGHWVSQISQAFEIGFLHDGYGIRARLGIATLAVPNIYRIGPGPRETFVSGDAFAAWHAAAAAALAAPAAELPCLHQIWVTRGYILAWKERRGAWFTAGGEPYYASASLSTEIRARKFHEVAAVRQRKVPRFEEALPGVALDPPGEDRRVPISPSTFEALFARTGVTLESRRFAEAFAEELSQLAAAAAHARACPGPLRFSHF